MRRWVLIGSLLALLTAGQIQVRAAGEPTGSPALADLDADASLDAVVPTEGLAPRELFARVAEKTGKAFVILGRAEVPAERLAHVSGKPVRQLLQVVAEQAKSRWRKYRDFYLLYPEEMERHEAKPVRRDKLYPELDVKIRGTFQGEAVHEALQKLGASQRVQLVLIGTGGTPLAFRRDFQPTLIAAEGKHLEELCWALTKVFGDPWERLGRAHALLFSGRALTDEEKRKALPAVAISELAASLTDLQQQQMASAEGLNFSQLSPSQRQIMASATSTIRSLSGGVAPGQIVLRRIGAGNGGLSDDISVYAAEPGGLRRIGSIVAPVPGR